jgi:hypothetical protein
MLVDDALLGIELKIWMILKIIEMYEKYTPDCNVTKHRLNFWLSSICFRKTSPRVSILNYVFECGRPCSNIYLNIIFLSHNIQIRDVVFKYGITGILVWMIRDEYDV